MVLSRRGLKRLRDGKLSSVNAFSYPVEEDEQLDIFIKSVKDDVRLRMRASYSTQGLDYLLAVWPLPTVVVVLVKVYEQAVSDRAMRTKLH
jgi:hypothetical protein